MERELTVMSTDPIDKNIPTNSHKMTEQDEEDDDEDINAGATSTATTAIPSTTTKDEDITDEETCTNGELKLDTVEAIVDDSATSSIKSESDDAEAQINVVDDIKEKIPESNCESEIKIATIDTTSESANQITTKYESTETSESMATDVEVADIEENQKDDKLNTQIQMDTIDHESTLNVHEAPLEEEDKNEEKGNDISAVGISEETKSGDAEIKIDTICPLSTKTDDDDDECLPTSPKVPRIDNEVEKPNQASDEPLVEKSTVDEKNTIEMEQIPLLTNPNVEPESVTVLLNEKEDLNVTAEPIVEEPGDVTKDNSNIITNPNIEITEITELQSSKIASTTADQEPIITEPELENEVTKPQQTFTEITERENVQISDEGIPVPADPSPILETNVEKPIIEATISEQTIVSISETPQCDATEIADPLPEESLENVQKVDVPIVTEPSKPNLDELVVKLNADDVVVVQPEIIPITTATTVASPEIIPESSAPTLLPSEKNIENTEKMSVEENETNPVAHSAQIADSVMEATSIIPASNPDDDEQMDIDEANSIDPMDL